MDEYKQSILCMSHIPGLGSKRIQAILQAFGENWWNSKAEEVRSVAGIGQELAELIIQARSQLDPIRIQQSLKYNGIDFYTRDECEFPALLRMIPNPPLFIFTKGHIQVQDQFAIAVVGTRKPTYYGIESARYLGEHAAKNGLTIISGMARGIDRYAHEGTLLAGGRTGAILAHGLDQIYPREHRMLADKICEQGFLLSEFPPGFPAKPQQFTARNRIISGLSLCTIVVEAGWKSGALATAEFALEQGRDVMAVPGSIFDATSVGTNTLLFEGATPVRSFDDVLHVVARMKDCLQLSALPQFVRGRETAQLRSNLNILHKSTLEGEEGSLMKKLLEKIPVTGVRVHDLVNCISNLPLAKLYVILVKMEVQGWVTRSGDTVYLKTSRQL